MRGGWIDVRERLPESGGYYLVCADDGRCQRLTIAPFARRFSLSGRRAYWRITHWMPLPDLPAGGRGREEPKKSRSRYYSKA